MTVTSEISESDVYFGDGSTNVWPYTFYITSADEIVLYVRSAAGVETVVQSGFTVSGVGLQAGGNVTYPTTSERLAVGERIRVGRRPPLLQPLALTNDVNLYRRLIEQQLDRLTFMSQWLSTLINRGVQLPPTSSLSLLFTPEPSAGKLIGWNAAATGLANYDGPSEASVSPLQIVLDLAAGDATISPTNETNDTNSIAIAGTAADDVDYTIEAGQAEGQLVEIDYRGTAGEFGVAIKSGGTGSTIVSPITALTRYVARWDGTDWAIVGQIPLSTATGLAVLPEIGILLTPLTGATDLTAAHADLVLSGGQYKRQWLSPLHATPATALPLRISGDNVTPKLAFIVDVPPDPDDEHGARTVELAATTLSFAGDFTDDSAVIEVTGGVAALAVLEAGDTIVLQDVDDWSSTDYDISAIDTEADPPTITLDAALTYNGEGGGPEESGEGLTFSVSKVVGEINRGTAPLRLVPGTRAIISIGSNPLTGPVVNVDGGVVAPSTVHGDIVASAEFDADDTPPALVDFNVTLPVKSLTTGAKTADETYAGRKLLADDAITINAGIFPAGTVMAVWYTSGSGQPSFVDGTNVNFAMPFGKIAAPAVANTAITVHFAAISGSDEVWHVEGNLDDAP